MSCKASSFSLLVASWIPVFRLSTLNVSRANAAIVAHKHVVAVVNRELFIAQNGLTVHQTKLYAIIFHRGTYAHADAQLVVFIVNLRFDVCSALFQCTIRRALNTY